MALSENNLRKLDIRLQELAKSNFDSFCQMTGVDKIQAYVCLEKSRGRTDGSIANSLGITRQAVSARNKKCKCE